jgi:hypothetical protein
MHQPDTEDFALYPMHAQHTGVKTEQFEGLRYGRSTIPEPASAPRGISVSLHRLFVLTGESNKLFVQRPNEMKITASSGIPEGFIQRLTVPSPDPAIHR